MIRPDMAGPGAPFGLSWGASAADVMRRLPGVRPKAETGTALTFHTDSVLEIVQASGGFLPSVLLTGSEHGEDEVTFSFSDDRLQSVTVCFGYGFAEIGQDPDALSDQAMSAFARAELHRSVFDFAARYGAPALLSELPNRHGRMHVQGTALFVAADSGQIQLLFGHDGGSNLVGEVRYREPVADPSGL